MKRHFTLMATCLAIALFVLLSFDKAGAVRLKDLTSVKGARINQLIGYGLVVGLDGTGDGSKSPFTGQALVNMLENLNIYVNKDDIKVKNVAGVMITASLPPFVKIGQNIDVTLSALGDAESLQGGTLIATQLKALDGEVYAVAQGPISIGGFEFRARGQQDSVQQNHLNVARIPNGATVEREVPVSFLGKNEFILHLNEPDFTTVTRTVKAIDRFLDGSYATAQDGSTISVRVPEGYRNNEIALLADLESLEVIPDYTARVIVDERTGTVVMGENVTISALAVAHGNLNVQVSAESVPFSRSAEVSVAVQEQKSKLVDFEPGVTLGDLVQALNSVGVTPRDLIAILQAIKAAGALQAELEII